MDIKKLLPITIFIAIIFIAIAFNQNDDSPSISDETTLNTFKDSLSYSIGINIGKNLPAYADLDKALIKKGLEDFLTNEEPLLNVAERQEILMKFNIEMAGLEREEMREVGEEFHKLSRENKIKGQTFLDENKTKEGVLVRRSNLQFKKIVIGTGDIPDYDDEVTVHYSGYLIDGHKFDSSHDRGTPATFPVKGVISGWTEILQMMPVGSKWEVYIPYNLAYGESGVPGQEMGTFVIPPASVLIFEIELLGIVK
jgi:FKBP-type peptidyl-prolyl cis-trans isomerase